MTTSAFMIYLQLFCLFCLFCLLLLLFCLLELLFGHCDDETLLLIEKHLQYILYNYYLINSDNLFEYIYSKKRKNIFNGVFIDEKVHNNNYYIIFNNILCIYTITNNRRNDKQAL